LLVHAEEFLGRVPMKPEDWTPGLVA